MMYVKGVLSGFGTVLLGCLFAPIALIIWDHGKSPSTSMTVSFSPMGLMSHLAHSVGFWAFFIVLFTAGFVLSVLFPKR